MLEHYGRIQQSDFDQIAEACVQVKERKNQTMGQKETHLVPFLFQNEVAQKAAQYTAVEGEFGCHGAESPTYTNLQHALENKAHDGSKRQALVSCVNCQNVLYGGGGNRTRVPILIRISVYVCIRFFGF